MDFGFFFQSLEEICSRSLVAAGRPLRAAVIANPRAGGFTIASRSKAHSQTLRLYAEKAAGKNTREMSGKAARFLTDAKGAGRQAASALIDEAAACSGPFYLIVTASGDGTCLEVLSAVYSAPAAVRRNMAVLRLPLGTGNDGSCCPTLSGALDLLLNPSEVFYAPALRLATARGDGERGGAPLLAFNILSLGADAFVTQMTNKVKGKLPGDSYKLWVDIAAVFYDLIYKVDYFDVRAFDEDGGEAAAFREKTLLLAMGASGYRTYGAGKKILPDSRNVCLIKQTSLFNKLILKNQLMKGRHPESPLSINFNAKRLEFSTNSPVLAQMDGETILLEARDFPASIELTEPVIPLLKTV